MDAWFDELKIAERENEELKAQIQKMKCCGNCKHSSYSALFHQVVCIKALCRDFDKWELAE